LKIIVDYGKKGVMKKVVVDVLLTDFRQ